MGIEYRLRLALSMTVPAKWRVMSTLYRTTSLCPECGSDCAGWYEADAEGVTLRVECPDHGVAAERVERDVAFFQSCYEQHYDPPVAHLVLPITYRCNQSCRYCYTLSNAALSTPADRSLEALLAVMRGFEGNITLIGGEPTLRHDLMPLIQRAKEQAPQHKLSLGTNGQKLSDLNFVHQLQDHGLDFVFLSLNDVAYEVSQAVWENKIAALENCHRLRMPVWLQRTVDRLPQVDSLAPLIERHGEVIFNITLRVVKPFGLVHPDADFYVSDILRYLDKERESCKGTSPFNRQVRWHRKKVKVCSWVNDMTRLDPIDSRYLISNDTVTTFHRGMKLDEVLIKARNVRSQPNDSRWRVDAKASSPLAHAEFRA